MSDELIKETPKNIIILDSKEYELPPFNLNLMEAIESEFNCSIENIGEEMSKRRAGTVKRLLTVLLSKRYPELTPARLGELVTMHNLADVSERIAKVIGG